MDVVLSLLRTIAAALIGFFLALGAFFTGHTGAIVPSPAATSTPAFPTATTTQKATAPAKSATSTQKSGLPGAAKQGAGTGNPRTFVSPPLPQYSIEALNTLARASLINVLCTTESGGSFSPISGSGVIVDSRGIILTNAHVGQYFLLRDYPAANNVQCVIRTGSPAQPRYTAELLYLPPAWIAQNSGQIASSTPTGTGENDYSFLLITGSTNPASALPGSFPALPMDGAEPSPGDRMVLAAYPAGFLGGISIELNLYISSAVATVGQVYTFDDPANIDLFSLGGTVVSQSGSSGGAVINGAGKLNGLISTEVTADTTAGRDLRAITIAHINRSLFAGGQGGITALLSHDAAQFAADFNAKVAPAETKALENALKQ